MCVSSVPTVFVKELKNYCSFSGMSTLLRGLKDATGYEVKEEKQEIHEWGKGGRRILVTLLLKDNEPVIISIHDVRWDTCSDDSSDYEFHNVKVTYLIKEDQFATQVFGKIGEQC